MLAASPTGSALEMTPLTVRWYALPVVFRQRRRIVGRKSSRLCIYVNTRSARNRKRNWHRLRLKDTDPALERGHSDLGPGERAFQLPVSKRVQEVDVGGSPTVGGRGEHLGEEGNRETRRALERMHPQKREGFRFGVRTAKARSTNTAVREL